MDAKKMTNTEMLIKLGAKLIKLCDTKHEAMKVFDDMKDGTVAPHNGKWAVLS